jgi:hypothetical protein
MAENKTTTKRSDSFVLKERLSQKGRIFIYVFIEVNNFFILLSREE